MNAPPKKEKLCAHSEAKKAANREREKERERELLARNYLLNGKFALKTILTHTHTETEGSKTNKKIKMSWPV